MEDTRYAFQAEVYDNQAEITRNYLICYFPYDQTTHIYDLKNRRQFLRRMKTSIKDTDLFLGNVVEVYGRQFTLVNYADEFTKNQLGTKQEYSFSVPLNSSIHTVFQSIIETNLILKKITTFQNSGKMLGITVIGEDAENLIAQHIPGKDTWNSNYGLPVEPCLKNSTCCIIKPHAVRDKCYGHIISDILSHGWTINIINTVQFNLDQARQFLEIYQGVVDEFRPLVEEFKSSKCIALEITHETNTQDIVSEFREFVGPRDPTVARKIREQSIRAKYGVDLVQNAVHTTDISEDAERDVQYLFEKLTPVQTEV